MIIRGITLTDFHLQDPGKSRDPERGHSGPELPSGVARGAGIGFAERRVRNARREAKESSAMASANCGPSPMHAGHAPPRLPAGHFRYLSKARLGKLGPLRFRGERIVPKSGCGTADTGGSSHRNVCGLSAIGWEQAPNPVARNSEGKSEGRRAHETILTKHPPGPKGEELSPLCNSRRCHETEYSP